MLDMADTIEMTSGENDIPMSNIYGMIRPRSSESLYFILYEKNDYIYIQLINSQGIFIESDKTPNLALPSRLCSDNIHVLFAEKVKELGKLNDFHG